MYGRPQKMTKKKFCNLHNNMKNKLILLIGTYFMFTQVMAQTAREVGVEIKANINSSNNLELKWLQQ